MRSYHVLLVDDDEDDYFLTHTYLSRLNDIGVSLSWCSSLKQAASYLDQHRPDLILLDYNLKDGEGLQLAEQLRSRGSEVPILLVSLHPYEEINCPQGALAGLIDGFVDKRKLNAHSLQLEMQRVLP